MVWQDKRIVMVEWKDAACDSSWQSAGTIFKVVTCWTVGILGHEDEEVITILGTMAETGDFNQSMTIPKVCITSMEDIAIPTPDNVVSLQQ